MESSLKKIKFAKELKEGKIPNDKWNDELSKIKINREDMNKLILNYLIIEGYKEAVVKFMKETNIVVEYDLSLLEKRMQIRNHIVNGKIDEAINQINNINSEILEKNPSIHFELEKQKLIEIIKANKIEEAIAFAQNTLFPITVNNPKLLSELEKIMSLLAYEDINNSPFKEVGKSDQLKKLSSIVNLQILASQMQPTDLILPLVMKLLKYSQQELKKEIKFPEIISVCPLQFSKVEQ
jgi:hypothetical protein